MRATCLALAGCLLLPSPPPPDGVTPGFTDVTRAAGVDRPHHNRRFDNPYARIMAGYTALGASASVADYDGDGFEDVFVTDSSADGRNHLYRNNGDFTFTDRAAEAGVAAGNDDRNASADSLWLDVDNDGRPDLFVVRFGRSQLFRNRGDGTFADITRDAGLDRYMNAITAVAFDYDRDGDVDLFVGSYFRPVDVFRPDTPRFFPESFETAANGGGVQAFRNEGRGRFVDVTDRIGLRTSGWTLDLGHGDADNDGDDDLYVACDFGTDRFFVNTGEGTFADRTERAIGIDTKKGMNASWGDADNDGRLDVFVTNITDDYMREGNFLWRNNGDLTFTDVARETGAYDTGWGWGAAFFDYDNDGWLDLYVTNGWVSAGPESYVPDIFEMIVKPDVDLADARNWPPMGTKSLSGYQKKKLLHNEGGHAFVDQAARHGVDSTRDGRGVAVADFDHDGRLDMFVANANSAPLLYRNVMPRGPHWLTLSLEGTRSNRAAVGAQVRVTAGGRTWLRFVDGGNGFAAQNSARVHVGLGQVSTVDAVDVRWPSGARQTFGPMPVDRTLRLVEGDASPRAFTATRPQGGSDPLDRLEARVAAEPDDLRAGNEYRMTVIAAKAYDRALAFFKDLTAKHPDSANAHLHYGFAYVDKIPAAGAISQVILANSALNEFSRSLELRPSWIGYYTRGASYLYWPKIFDRTRLGVADLETALGMQRAEGRRSYHVRTFVALGDGYWIMDNEEKARATWRAGLQAFPDSEALKQRVAATPEALKTLLNDTYDPSRRVDTNLSELWGS